MQIIITCRSTLHALASRKKSISATSSIYTNYRYLSTPEKVSRLSDLQHQKRLAKLKIDRLLKKLDLITIKESVCIDDETSDDLKHIMSEQENEVLTKFPEGTFQRVFWEQQKKISATPDKRGFRWHPLMIKWCLYLRHLSGKAYETIRDSGCIYLPSQRTLRDYSHCIRAHAGYSSDVDLQLIRAANILSCPEWHKFVILLIDEMYIREDLVYNKHSGRLIGFTDLGSINNHLSAFERSINEGEVIAKPLAKSMLAIMVKGLFTPLKFPYVQFPCVNISGDMLFDPFRKAVYRLERMGLKVSAHAVTTNKQ